MNIWLFIVFMVIFHRTYILLQDCKEWLELNELIFQAKLKRWKKGCLQRSLRRGF
jgi:hypothetical protein